MELKKTFLVLSASCVLLALLLVGLVFMVCNSISSTFPTGGIEILADGSAIKLETPTVSQQSILSMFGIIQIVSCIVLPMGGLALSGILYYHIKLKHPIAALHNGITRIQNHDLDFFMPVRSDDELGQLCAAFDTMREELLKSNQELWRQAEERKRLNAAFSHDLRNPITVLKGTVKILRRGTADELAIDRLESYTLRIEQYVEAMSSIQRLEQMPVRINECSYSLLHSELEETAKILAGALDLSVSTPDNGTIQLDHGLFLTVAENLIGNATRFAKSKITIRLEQKKNFLLLSVTDDGPGYPVELIQNGPKPFGKMKEDSAHFGMGLYSSQTLCLKHGGTLTLENRKGYGATATASFQNKTEILSNF
ncbi:MAG: HAMP domain-containing sensor histidine kinase [Eubacteriales bacterium]|nr:HAMP domain-containing sensor histidine kinase [Eubacteriales bacterium]